MILTVLKKIIDIILVIRQNSVVVVVLPNPIRGMGTWRNSTETQQSGHAPRPGPEVKNESGAEDGAPERLECGTVKEELSQVLQSVRRRCMKNSPSILSFMGKRTKEGCDRDSEV